MLSPVPLASSRNRRFSSLVKRRRRPAIGPGKSTEPSLSASAATGTFSAICSPTPSMFGARDEPGFARPGASLMGFYFFFCVGGCTPTGGGCTFESQVLPPEGCPWDRVVFTPFLLLCATFPSPRRE